jgi:hypothetical protein
MVGFDVSGAELSDFAITVLTIGLSIKSTGGLKLGQDLDSNTVPHQSHLLHCLRSHVRCNAIFVDDFSEFRIKGTKIFP